MVDKKLLLQKYDEPRGIIAVMNQWIPLMRVALT